MLKFRCNAGRDAVMYYFLGRDAVRRLINKSHFLFILFMPFKIIIDKTKIKKSTNIVYIKYNEKSAFLAQIE